MSPLGFLFQHKFQLCTGAKTEIQSSSAARARKRQVWVTELVIHKHITSRENLLKNLWSEIDMSFLYHFLKGVLMGLSSSQEENSHGGI